jgi:hypothetical protein
MWTKYMNVFGEYDKRISDTWKEDADGLLVFVSHNHHLSLSVAMTNQKTGLFSATVGAFIIESYKSLSPDPTVVLGQISQQLAGFNGTYPNPQTPQPTSPSTSAILVNAMWLMSLVLSITSALLATLLQQWARRYTQMPQIPSLASHRARDRSYLFLGTLKYGMNFAVETVPTLLHISVFLFFIGLVMFFFPINKASRRWPSLSQLPSESSQEYTSRSLFFLSLVTNAHIVPRCLGYGGIHGTHPSHSARSAFAGS